MPGNNIINIFPSFFYSFSPSHGTNHITVWTKSFSTQVIWPLMMDPRFVNSNKCFEKVFLLPSLYWVNRRLQMFVQKHQRPVSLTIWLIVINVSWSRWSQASLTFSSIVTVVGASPACSFPPTTFIRTTPCLIWLLRILIMYLPYVDQFALIFSV